MDSAPIRLTEYSHGSGCGCKIAPGVLEKILKTEIPQAPFPELLVGNQSKDDAAAFDLGNGTSVLSTTDFFMPIVDDPFEFGRIAATNALSDIYAMGGKPLMAIAILGWPIDKLPPEVAQRVVEGGRSACADAGIPLAGGHSIDAPEPMFGLAVTGLVENRFLKQNNTASSGCQLFLTKPLGIGILSTAQKKKLLEDDHSRIAPDTMCQLNKIGSELAQIEGIEALTDVTGFGLLGHLSEICEGSGISAMVDFDSVPTLPHTHTYLDLGCSPGGAQRNFDSYGDKIGDMSDRQRSLLCDPQTSGGLLAVVRPEALEEFHQCAKAHGLELQPIGETIAATNPLIQVR
ncbi:selenide, water dikinase SelD [Solemya velum gill symbiont]|uniref:Selenide, water dikinase n=4 Tax=Solemya velum gill symbiont TaxID=2340 RepID=A0A0B0H3C8_SOVGS|nr:selenide, water dikinase SelD [Solemya velum gill symbiont]KHF24723.1 selenophosphate synthase [Solemya velum gill symbiont]OOY34748.1 selenide, water dikinase SelD [Solemya velum gill symbiont]OOY37640.1 selenide, water dikinase SelD [Solemya velum gill symbiont]OOY45706.1 selenide, water dikinase SelD [Solemya velum gill symbiont]OOY46290.1 selenide, water dikinase SelD [Solemya velum gill symbiont]